jgi:hypothetical protein
MSANKLLKAALSKSHNKTLERVVVEKLVEAGKSHKKAVKLVARTLLKRPQFVAHGSRVKLAASRVAANNAELTRRLLRLAFTQLSRLQLKELMSRMFGGADSKDPLEAMVDRTYFWAFQSVANQDAAGPAAALTKVFMKFPVQAVCNLRVKYDVHHVVGARRMQLAEGLAHCFVHAALGHGVSSRVPTAVPVPSGAAAAAPSSADAATAAPVMMKAEEELQRAIEEAEPDEEIEQAALPARVLERLKSGGNAPASGDDVPVVVAAAEPMARVISAVIKELKESCRNSYEAAHKRVGWRTEVRTPSGTFTVWVRNRKLQGDRRFDYNVYPPPEYKKAVEAAVRLPNDRPCIDSDPKLHTCLNTVVELVTSDQRRACEQWDVEEAEVGTIRWDPGGKDNE